MNNRLLPLAASVFSALAAIISYQNSAAVKSLDDRLGRVENALISQAAWGTK